jgi:hypothetical protein
MKHIRKEMKGTQLVAWCGQLLWAHDWAFQSIDHAILTVASGSTVPDDLCAKCIERAREQIISTENILKERQGQ